MINSVFEISQLSSRESGDFVPVSKLFWFYCWDWDFEIHTLRQYEHCTVVPSHHKLCVFILISFLYLLLSNVCMLLREKCLPPHFYMSTLLWAETKSLITRLLILDLYSSGTHIVLRFSHPKAKQGKALAQLHSAGHGGLLAARTAINTR